jgi:hypothetical protein
MFAFRVRIDVENLRERLSRDTDRSLDYADTIAWLNGHGFRTLLNNVPDDWSVDFVADDAAVEQLQPWEVLERLPVSVAGAFQAPEAIGLA